MSPTKPKISANGPTSLCAGGSVLLTATAGKGYKWSNGATTQSITVTQPGSYSVEVTDANGCIGKSDDIVVSVAGKLQAPKITYTDPLIVCQTGSLKMTVTVQDGAAYVWKRNGVAIYDDSNEYTATEAGVYTVELSNFCGAVTGSNRVEFKILEPIPDFAVTAASAQVFCMGGSVKLSVPSFKDATYAWFKDGTQVSGTSRDLVATEAGSYTAKITNKCGTYSSSNAIAVEVLPLPVAPTAKSGESCSKTAVTLTAAGGSPGMYRWYTAAKGGTAIAGADAASFTTPVLSATTTYYVAVTNGQCESNRVAVEAIINTKPAPVQITANGDLTFCEGGMVALAAAAVPYTDYIWLRNGQEFKTGGTSIQVTESGEYTLQLKNECGTTNSSNSLKVEVVPPPAAPVVPLAAVAVCGPGRAELTATGGADGEYRWYESATAATALPASTNGTFTTPVLQTSTAYYVSLVQNGCEGERVAVPVIVNPLPVAGASVQDTEIETGQSTRLTGSGGVSYSWRPAAGLDDPTAASPIAAPKQTTRYTLTVQNQEGCEDTTSVVVTVRQLLVVPNAFSPNGDGVNDTWEIANIEYFPDAKVEIYNRWGNLIYERSRYQNDWGGTYRGVLLPVSTYFYVITIPNKSKLTGYLNIVN